MMTLDSMLQNGEHASLACGENGIVVLRGTPVVFGETCTVICVVPAPAGGLIRIHGGMPDESGRTVQAQPAGFVKTEMVRSPPPAGMFQPRPKSVDRGVYE